MTEELDIGGGNITNKDLAGSLFGGLRSDPIIVFDESGQTFAIQILSVARKDEQTFFITGKGVNQSGNAFTCAGEINTAYQTGSLAIEYI